MIELISELITVKRPKPVLFLPMCWRLVADKLQADVLRRSSEDRKLLLLADPGREQRSGKVVLRVFLSLPGRLPGVRDRDLLEVGS